MSDILDAGNEIDSPCPAPAPAPTQDLGADMLTVLASQASGDEVGRLLDAADALAPIESRVEGDGDAPEVSGPKLRDKHWEFDPTTGRVKLWTKSGEEETTVEEIANRGLRLAEFTRRSQQNASVRKEVEQMRSQADQARMAYLQGLTTLGAAIEHYAPANDPQKQIMLDHIAQRQKAALEDQAREAMNRQREVVAAETEKLLAALPEWHDPRTAQKEKELIADHLINDRGFTPAEVSTITDARLLLILREQALAAKAPKPVTGLRKAGRTLAPGSAGDLSAQRRAPSNRENALEAHRKRGTVDSAAKAFESLL
jgi:hypothetical protein